MCVIDHENKFIYISIPKCGTTATINFLEKIMSKNSMVIKSNRKNNIGLRKHSTALEIKKVLDKYSKYVTFTVIRNPYDRAVSFYEYKKRKNCKQRIDMSFTEFIKDHIFIHDIKNEMSWITDENNNIIVDHVIKYEDSIENDITRLLSTILKTKIDTHFCLLNKTVKKHDNYQKYYSDDDIEIVKNKEKLLIETFNYEF